MSLSDNNALNFVGLKKLLFSLFFRALADSIKDENEIIVSLDELIRKK